MTLDVLIMFFGAFVTVLPFLGFPTSWDNVLLVIAGLFIIGLGIVVRRRESPRYDTREVHGTESEHAPRFEHEA